MFPLKKILYCEGKGDSIPSPVHCPLVQSKVPGPLPEKGWPHKRDQNLWKVMTSIKCKVKDPSLSVYVNLVSKLLGVTNTKY